MKKNKKLILFIVLMLVLITIISISCILAKKSVMVSQVNGVATKNLNATNTVYKVTLSKNGGTGGASYLYVCNGKVYTDASCTDELPNSETSTKAIEIPNKDGYKFVGYFKGEDKVIMADGKVGISNYGVLAGITEDTTIVAKYNPVYIVDFDFDGGSNGTQKVYMSYISSITTEPSETSKGLRMYSDEACTNEISGQKIVVPERTGYKFLGYKINNGVTNQEYSFDSEGNLLDIATR